MTDDCGGHVYPIAKVIDFTSSNDFIVLLTCGHEETIDHAGWTEYPGSKGPQLIVEEAHCMKCEEACAICNS